MIQKYSPPRKRVILSHNCLYNSHKAKPHQPQNKAKPHGTCDLYRSIIICDDSITFLIGTLMPLFPQPKHQRKSVHTHRHRLSTHADHKVLQSTAHKHSAKRTGPLAKTASNEQRTERKSESEREEEE